MKKIIKEISKRLLKNDREKKVLFHLKQTKGEKGTISVSNTFIIIENKQK